MSNVIRQIDWRSPINWLDSLNRGLVGKWLVLPGMGGSKWQDLTKKRDVSFVNMDLTTHGIVGHSGRPGSYGDIGFDGDDDYAEITTGILALDTTNFSAAFWVYLRDRELTTPTVIFGLASRTNFHIKRSFYWQTGSLKLDNSPGSGGTLNITTPSQNAWHHYVITDAYNSARAIYVDGVLENSDSGEDYTGSTLDAIDIFSWVDTGRNIDGMFDDLSIWNRILSASDVTQLYHQSKLGYPNTLNWITQPRGFVEPAAGGVPTTPYYAWQAAMT